ncbi:hypothetical protein ABKV19_002542 [Rosa sericea]
MGGSNGVRLFYSLARRSTTSVYARVLGGGYRTFNTGICNNSRVLGNSSSTTTTTTSNVYRRFPGALSTNWTTVRSIHGTASMAARDYYETLGVSKDLVPLRIHFSLEVPCSSLIVAQLYFHIRIRTCSNGAGREIFGLHNSNIKIKHLLNKVISACKSLTTTHPSSHY